MEQKETDICNKQKDPDNITDSVEGRTLYSDFDRNLDHQFPASDYDDQGGNFDPISELSQLSIDSLTLDKLPLELLIHICNFLEAGFVIHTFSKVCQLFKDLFEGDSYWITRIRKRWPKPYPPVSDEDFNWQEACIEREKCCRVWSDIKNQTESIVYKDTIFAPVDSVHLMENGRFLASGSRDRYLTLLDLSKYDPTTSKQNDMKVYASDKAHKGWIWSLTSNDKTLCTGSWDRYIKTWDLEAGVVETQSFKCRSAILGLHIEDNMIFGCGFDQLVYSIDPRENVIKKRKYHRGPVLCLAADENYVVTGSEDKTIAIYDRRAGTVYKTIQLENYPMSLNLGHRQLWVGDKTGGIHVYNTTCGQFKHIESCDVGHTGKVTGIIYTPGALFTCCTDTTIKVLEPSLNPGTINTLTSHEGEVARISYQNGVLASAGSDVSVRIWRPKDNWY